MPLVEDTLLTIVFVVLFVGTWACHFPVRQPATAATGGITTTAKRDTAADATIGGNTSAFQRVLASPHDLSLVAMTMVAMIYSGMLIRHSVVEDASMNHPKFEPMALTKYSVDAALLLTIVYRSVVDWRQYTLSAFSASHAILTILSLVGGLDAVWMLWDRPQPFRHMYKGRGVVPGELMFIGMVARTCVWWNLFIRLSCMALAQDPIAGGGRRIRGILHDGLTPPTAPHTPNPNDIFYDPESAGGSSSWEHKSSTNNGDIHSVTRREQHHYTKVMDTACRHFAVAITLLFCIIGFALLAWFGEMAQSAIQWISFTSSCFTILIAIFVTGVQSRDMQRVFAKMSAPYDQWRIILKSCLLATAVTYCVLCMYLERNDTSEHSDRVTPTVTLMLLIAMAPSYLVGYSMDIWTHRNVALLYLTCLLVQVIAMTTSELHHTQTNLHLLIDYHHHSRIGALIDQTVWAVLYTLVWNAVEMCERLWGVGAMNPEQEAEHRRITRPLLPSSSPTGGGSNSAMVAAAATGHADAMGLMPIA